MTAKHDHHLIYYRTEKQLREDQVGPGLFYGFENGRVAIHSLSDNPAVGRGDTLIALEIELASRDLYDRYSHQELFYFDELPDTMTYRFFIPTDVLEDSIVYGYLVCPEEQKALIEGRRRQAQYQYADVHGHIA